MMLTKGVEYIKSLFNCPKIEMRKCGYPRNKSCGFLGGVVGDGIKVKS